MNIERTQSAVMVAVLTTAQRYASTDHPVLILGETGTGKTELAGYIHRLSPRCGKPFVEVNCGGLAEGLIDSQLFGHDKGAFTGALRDHEGFFEQAHGGTIFLDEIGELSLEAQRKLLTVLQSGRVQRVGSARVRTVNVRVVAATHRDLKAEVKRGRFREDLYFRLATLDLHMPPLRERREDIPLILAGVAGLSDEAAGAVASGSYSWPGNVRELLGAACKAKVLGWGAAEIEARYGVAAEATATGAREDVVVELAGRRGGVRAVEVVEALGIGRNAADLILSRLARRGKLERKERGVYVAICLTYVTTEAAAANSDPVPSDDLDAILNGDITPPPPYDAAKAQPWTWLGRRGGLWPRAVAGYFFEGGCPRCGCADCEPDSDGALTCEVAELDAEMEAEARSYEEVCP